MTIYLIKEDKTYSIYNNVIEWCEYCITYKAGKGRAKIYAGEGEYFTDQLIEKVEENNTNEQNN